MINEEQTRPVLTTHNLRVGYQGQILYDGLSLSLMPGELVCFMGPNGSGKSTLIRTLAGIQPPLSGRFEFNKGYNMPVERMIALVLTDPIRNFNMTARDLVAFGRYPYLGWNITLTHTDHSIIENALKAVNITHLADRRVNELSDGQLQMTLIARALAQETPLLILDEPTAHLDLNNRVEIMKMLRQLSRETGKAILLATHELDLALQMADQIWLSGKDGNISTGIPEDLVLNGTFDEIFQFKGFDLKTGKVQHQAFQTLAVALTGDDYYYLWTKNALERNGYIVSDHMGGIRLEIIRNDESVLWKINGKESFVSVSDMLSYLKRCSLEI